MVVDYPAIVFEAAEVKRESELKHLAQAFQAEMDEQHNTCVLKGGTALRFKMRLPRPSTDLDFEALLKRVWVG